MVFFFACLEFSSYDVIVLKEHRRLPSTSSQRRVHQHRTDELVEDVQYVFFTFGSLVLYYDVRPLSAILCN